MIQDEFQPLAVPFQRASVKLAARIVTAIWNVLFTAPFRVGAGDLTLRDLDIAKAKNSPPFFTACPTTRRHAHLSPLTTIRPLDRLPCVVGQRLRAPAASTRATASNSARPFRCRPLPLRIGCRALQHIPLHIPRKAARRLMGRTSGLPCAGRWRACGSGRACRSWCADVAVPPAAPGACGCRGRPRAGALGETSPPDRRVPEWRAAGRSRAGGGGGDPIKMEPGAPGLALDCVCRRFADGPCRRAPLAVDGSRL
jgi:hypothetical protein